MQFHVPIPSQILRLRYPYQDGLAGWAETRKSQFLSRLLFPVLISSHILRLHYAYQDGLAG